MSSSPGCYKAERRRGSWTEAEPERRAGEAQPDARSSEASWPASRRGAREGPARGPWPRVRTVEPRFVVRLICSGCEHRRTQRRGRARKEEGGAPPPPAPRAQAWRGRCARARRLAMPSAASLLVLGVTQRCPDPVTCQPGRSWIEEGCCGR